MAIKVLNVDPSRISSNYKIICHACGAELAYTSKDVLKYSGTDYSGGPDGREWIVCPNCGEEVTIRSW